MKFLNFRAVTSALFGRKNKNTRVQGSAHEIIGRLPDSELSEKFIAAAGANDVPLMKKLRRLGADINFVAEVKFGAGTLVYRGNTVTQPSDLATPLMVAIHNGAFDAALYLAQEKADASFERVSTRGESEKALDLLLTDHIRESVKDTATLIRQFNGKSDYSPEQRIKDYKTDLYSPSQRLQIFKAMVDSTKDPLRLVSPGTLYNAVNWGRAEMISGLFAIGVEIRDEHFVQAGEPIHRTRSAIATMEAILPFVRDVNVTNSSGQNAGHKVASSANLPAFQWLEQRGLDKNAKSGNNIPTYAHCVASDLFGKNDSSAERLEFAQYLIDHGYPIDVEEGLNGQWKRTPTDVAFADDCMDIGMLYINAGARVRSQHLMAAIEANYKSKASSHDVIELISVLEERGVLDQKIMLGAFDKIVEYASDQDENISAFAPIVSDLMRRGLVLDTRKQQIANMIMDKNFAIRDTLRPGNG